MAAAAPSPLASSVEKTNGAKLSRLLIDGGTTVLRNVFDHYHPPANLAADLNANYLTLNNLLRRRVLHPAQWDQLFPPGGITPDSKTFDITLLFLLLTNVCGLAPPLSGWHSKPPPSDSSFEANLARIRCFRNELYGHVTTTGVNTPTFNTLWQEINAVIVALGLNQAEIDRLEVEHCGEEDYLDVLLDWAGSEKDMKSQLKDIRQYQTETQQDVEKVLQTQLEDRKTLEDSKAKLDEVHQAQANIQETIERVRQTQIKEQKTIEKSESKLEDVHQAQTKTQETVEKVRQTQVEDRGTLQYIKTTLDEVRQTQTNMQGTVKKESYTQTQETVEAVEADLEQMKQVLGSLKEETKMESQADEVLRNLARSEFKGDIEYHVGRFQEGTREWVFKKAQNWLDDRNSQNRVMVISANAGMGKSVISAVICKRMQEAGRLSGSHFCQHNNARYRNPQLMLQSLACHLCQALPAYKRALVKQLSRNLGKDLNSMGVEELFALLFKEPLSSVADPGRNMLMVIDGLDESEYQERNELLDVIANHFCKLPCWIRFLCTTRPEKNIVEALKQLKPFQLEPNEEDNVKDIKVFLERRTQYLMRPENKGVIVAKLVEKSEGLMLYAYFLVSFIEENVSALDQGDLDGSLPLAISSVYHSYFKRLENELMKELGVKEENFLNLLCAVTASREPLPIDFVSKVLVPRANSLVAKRKVLKAIGSVSSLLPIRDGCLHVIHKSVKDWMTDASCYGDHDFIMDEKEGHRILANLCSDELDNLKQKGVHDTQFSPTLRYALQHGVRHMFQLEDCRTPSSSKLEKCVQRYVLDLDILYTKLYINFPMAAEDILWLQRQEISQGLSEDSKGLLNILKISLRKQIITFTNYPHVLFQTMLNEGGAELSPVASNLLQNKYPEIPYMEFVHKQMQKGAVLARFQCSSLVACLDVSTQLDYMVCECIDGTIHLWSLHTGKLVWKRPVMVKKLYFGNQAYRVMQCFGANLLSCYRSVVFHPTADVVLPGVLSHAYTIDGDLTPLFPESKCSFTVCSISGDKTKMLTDCPDDAKCIIMWSLENGSEITRTTTNGDVLSFAWSQDGKLLAIAHSIDSIDFVVIGGNLLPVASSSGCISIVDAMDGFKTLDEKETSELFGMIKFSPDCRSLLCFGRSFVGYGSERRCICIFGLDIDMTGHPSCTLYYCDPDDRSWENWEIQSHSEAGYLLGDPFSILEDGFDFVLFKETVLRGDFGDSSIDMLNISELRKTEKEAADIKIRDIVFYLSGEIVYVVSDEAEPTVSAWHVSTGKLIGQKSSQTNKRNLTVAVKEGVLLTTETATTLELWNFELSKCIRNWTNINGVRKMILVSEERVACEVEKKVIILDTTSGETVSTIPTSHGRLVTCNSKCQLLTYSSHSLQLSDGKATSWTIEISLHDAFGSPPAGLFSLSEQFVVIWATGPLDCRKEVYVLDALSGKTVHIVYEIKSIRDCKFVSDEECVISCSASSGGYCLQLFNIKSGDLLSEINLEAEVHCLAVCPRKRLLAIEQSDSKHGFKLIQVHLPQDKDNKKSKWVLKTRNHTKVKVGKQEVCSCLDGAKKRNPWIIS